MEKKDAFYTAVNDGLHLRVYLMVYLSMHLAISIKMHIRACEVALNDALVVARELPLWLHLLMQ